MASIRTSWVKLLAEDCTADDLLGHHRELRGASEVVDATDATNDLRYALDLQERLAASRRSVDQLAAVNDLALRLAPLHTLSEVLHEIAEHSKRSMAVDVSILMLRHESRLRVETVVGVMGALLPDLELEDGEGLAGQVLSAGKPAWTLAYLDDRSFAHLAAADDAVSGEQLAAVLGVPLAVDGDPIGVLLVADRHPRRFEAAEIQMLTMLAAHATAAIENTALLEQARDQANRGTAAVGQLELILEQQRRANRRVEELTAEFLSGKGVAGLLGRLQQALERPVLLVTDDPDDESRNLFDLVGGGGNDSTFLPGFPVIRFKGPEGPMLASRVPLQGGCQGYLVLGGADDSEEVRSWLLVGSTLLALAAASERAVAEAELRTRSELARALLSPGSDEAAARHRARAAGLNVDAIKTVAVIDPGSGREAENALPNAAQAGRHLASSFNGWSSDYDGKIVVFTRESADAGLLSEGRGLAAQQAHVNIGVADCQGDIAALRRAYDLAQQTAKVLHGLGRNGQCRHAAELGMYRSLFSQAGRDEIAIFVRAALGPLLDHDERHHRDLTTTLAVYLDQAQHRNRTCDLLHIHPNTLYQRLDRITVLLGASWREPEKALELQLALHLRKLAAL